MSRLEELAARALVNSHEIRAFMEEAGESPLAAERFFQSAPARTDRLVKLMVPAIAGIFGPRFESIVESGYEDGPHGGGTPDTMCRFVHEFAGKVAFLPHAIRPEIEKLMAETVSRYRDAREPGPDAPLAAEIVREAFRKIQEPLPVIVDKAAAGDAAGWEALLQVFAIAPDVAKELLNEDAERAARLVDASLAISFPAWSRIYYSGCPHVVKRTAALRAQNKLDSRILESIEWVERSQSIRHMVEEAFDAMLQATAATADPGLEIQRRGEELFQKIDVMKRTDSMAAENFLRDELSRRENGPGSERARQFKEYVQMKMRAKEYAQMRTLAGNPLPSFRPNSAAKTEE